MSERATSLRRRLSRLGIAKSGLASRPIPMPPVARALPWGDEVETPLGRAFRIENRYSAQHQHGTVALSDLLALDTTLAAEVARHTARQDLPLDRLLFLDTETTGLVGGTGTLAFLVGIGTFVGGEFSLRQYFLRDPSEESAMLAALREDLKESVGFVTFNGQVFDLPLLEARYVVGLKERLSLGSCANLDLLPPARRLWRRSLPDCSLGTLERGLLGVVRTEEDVPSEQIPGIYLDYLRRGDVSQINRVLYHNTVDVLSLVALAVKVIGSHQQARLSELSAGEALAVARWHQEAGRLRLAEDAYKKALASATDPARQEALRYFTALLKAQGRRDEAVQGWDEWHALSPADPDPCIELAKYYEWWEGDLASAWKWAEEAMLSLSHWPAGWERDEARAAVEHRIARLTRKLMANQGRS